MKVDVGEMNLKWGEMVGCSRLERWRQRDRGARWEVELSGLAEEAGGQAGEVEELGWGSA